MPDIVDINAGSPRRRGPVLSWEGSGGKGYIQVDVVTAFEVQRTSQPTQQSIETGAVFADHVIHLPEVLTLEVVQTEHPFLEYTGTENEFKDTELVSVDLTPFMLPQNGGPQGLLLLYQAAEGAVRKGATSLGILDAKQAPKALVYTPPDETERIATLAESLDDARINALPVTLTYRGRTWDNLCIADVRERHQLARASAEFTLTLQKIATVATQTTKQPTAAELRLAQPKPVKHKPPVKPTQPKADAVADKAKEQPKEPPVKRSWLNQIVSG